MGKGIEEGGRLETLTNLEKADSALGSNLSGRLKHKNLSFYYSSIFIQSADGGELRCEISGFEIRTRNICEEKFETECKTIQVYPDQEKQLSDFASCRFPRNALK